MDLFELNGFILWQNGFILLLIVDEGIRFLGVRGLSQKCCVKEKTPPTTTTTLPHYHIHYHIGCKSIYKTHIYSLLLFIPHFIPQALYADFGRSLGQTIDIVSIIFQAVFVAELLLRIAIRGEKRGGEKETGMPYTAYCVLCTVYCVLYAVCCMLYAVCCMLTCCSLSSVSPFQDGCVSGGSRMISTVKGRPDSISLLPLLWCLHWSWWWR